MGGGEIYDYRINREDSEEQFKALEERVHEFQTVVAHYISEINAGVLLAVLPPPPPTKLRKI